MKRTARNVDENSGDGKQEWRVSKPVIETHELTKCYGSLTALDQLSISIGSGQILGVIGPNGAGKTTMIRILVGLLRPTSGSATIDGVDCVRHARRIKRLVGYMPDNVGIYENMRVTEYLDFFAATFGIARQRRVTRISEVLEIAGAAHMKDLFVESLSHGMRQRIAVARTLLHDPKVLIMDEPANGLDPQARIDVRKLLLRLAEAGKTLIVTSHILPELSRVCSKIAIITRGKLRLFGPVSEIMNGLNSHRKFEAQLARVDQAELARQAILESPTEEAVRNVTVSEAESVVRFESRQTDESLARLLARLVQKQIAIAQLREVPVDLEDAFLSVADSVDFVEA
jgi:ABC-2 type transport system ATP-binding protein